jgi:SH3 domain protein
MGHQSMKGLLCFGLGMVLITATAWAEEMYVNEIVQITLRTGKGTDHKIVAMIETGKKVTLLDHDHDWSRVRTAEGREGYVLTRLLTREAPCTIRLRELKDKYEALMAQVATPVQEIGKLRRENQALKTDLADKQEALTNLTAAHEELKTQAADYEKAEAAISRTTTLLAARTRRVEACEEELERLSMNHSIRWILTGAGILTLGFVVGFSSRRQRRRSSLL